MNKKLIPKLILVLIFSLQLLACNCGYALGPGTTGANFLKIAVGARPAGMGEAFVATADDVSSVYWNPAGLTQVTDRQILFMHNFWLQGIHHDYIAYAEGGREYSLGFSALLLSAGVMDRTLEDASENYAGTDGKFTYTDSAFTFSFAQRVDGLSIGASLKIVRTLIDKLVGSTVGADIGMLYRTGEWGSLRFGVVLQNFGARLKYPGGTLDPLPLSLRVGCAYKVRTDAGPINLGVDICAPVDNRMGVYMGMEYLIEDMFLVRFGYKTDRVYDLGLLSGLCFGGGVKLQNIQIDYAFVPYGNLGLSHRISIIGRF